MKKELLIEEEKQVSAQDLWTKVNKLEIFISRAERRIARNEKQLALLRRELKEEVGRLKRKLVA